MQAVIAASIRAAAMTRRSRSDSENGLLFSGVTPAETTAIPARPVARPAILQPGLLCVVRFVLSLSQYQHKKTPKMTKATKNRV